MAEISWAQQAVDRFFEGRKHPCKARCDIMARSVAGASDVRDVDTPGSMSYTVVCTGCAGGKDLVVSFREPEAHLDPDLGRLARTIHGDLVPEASRHGEVEGSRPPLGIYTMPYLQGISCLDALGCQVEMDASTEERHACFSRHLARYFARCWSQPQHPSPEARGQTQDGIRRRLALLRASPSSGLGDCVVSEGEQSLPLLFAPAYPQVLSHGDLSRTNILVDEDSYEITGIVDWSRAEILPFGMDLDCLYLTTGYLDFEGWHDYACRSQLHEAFWTEFWSASGMGDDGQRSEIRHWAERAARIGAVLRYAFRRNADGSASEILAPEGSLAWRQLRTWLTT